MSKSNDTLQSNIGGYVIKVGDQFVASYRSLNVFVLVRNMPSSLCGSLSEIKEILHSKERAFSIAKHVNGQVFEIKCVPVEEDINDTSQDK